MADDIEQPATDPTGQALVVHEPGAEAPAGQATDLVAQRPGRPATEVWRRRVLAVRTGLPQLARNPVVVGVSTVAAGVVAQIAVDVVRRALGAPAPARSTALCTTGLVVHQVHAVHRVDVVHHVVHHVTHQLVDQAVRPGLPPSSGR